MSETIAIPSHPPFRDLTGRRFGRWKVLRYAGRNSQRKYLWLCWCDCGCTRVVSGVYLGNGESRSCGCRKHVGGRFERGDSGSPVHRVWYHMRSRCLDPEKASFPNYGGRGITICPAWEDYRNFARWAKESGYEPGLSIERIDVNGNYEPANCRWIPLGEQARNKRKSIFLTAFGETKLAIDWTKDSRCLVVERMFYWRINRGWEAERALTEAPETGQLLTAFGETKRVSQWVKDPRCRVTRKSLEHRLKIGWPHEESIGIPPKAGTKLRLTDTGERLDRLGRAIPGQE